MLGETLASSWQLDSFIRAFPLEYCAALLIRRLLAPPPDLPPRTREDIASLCNFEHGPTAGCLHLERWASTIALLRSSISTSRPQRYSSARHWNVRFPERVSVTKLCSEAMTDHSLDCWQYSFGVGTGFVSVLGQLTRSRDMLQSMASISRLFAARWAMAGSIDSVIAI